MKIYVIIVVLFIGVGHCICQDSLSYPMDSNTCKHGKVFKYYLNGNPKLHKTYEHGFLYGPYEKYYRNGQIKEKGFLDDVNQRNLLFQPSKVTMVKYRKNGEFKKSLESQIKSINEVPNGKCKCEDGNVKRIKSLLIGDWIKERMIPFDKSDKVIDTIYNNYDT